MAAGPADSELRLKITATLRERLLRFANQLDALDEEQLAVMHELVLLLERLAALPDEIPKH
jgi:hypothetical protein